MNNRLFIAGITSNEFANINQIVEPVKDLIDGLIFVVDNKGLSDGTFDYLNENKKQGTIIHYPWVDDFSMSFNQILLQGKMRHNQDWYIQLDSRERVNPDFIKSCKEDILEQFNKENVVACFQRSKPCLIKYTKFLRYHANPHCGISPFMGNVIDLSKAEGFEDDQKYIWSTRVGDSSWVSNGLKYMLYPHSNHTMLVWGEGHRFPNLSKEDVQKQYRQHEQARIWFLQYWSSLFNEWPTVESITEYMKKPYTEWDLKLREYFCWEIVFSNHYRWKILNETIENIMINQWAFSLKDLLNESKGTSSEGK